MNYCRWSRVAEWGVVAAVVAFHAWTFIPGTMGSPESPVASVFAECLPLCYLTLVGGWLLLGPGNPWLRGALAGGIAACWAIFFTDRFPNSAFELPEFGQAALVGFGLAALSVMVLLRLCGLRAVSVSVDRPAGGPTQFSIRSMIVATTVIAAMIGGLEYLRPWIREPSFDTLEAAINPWNFALNSWQTQAAVRSVVIATALAMVSCGAMFVVLRPGAIWLRGTMLAVAIPFLAAYLVHLSGSPSDAAVTRAAELATAFFALSGLIAITVLPLRLFGYRLMRRSAARDSATTLQMKPAASAARPARLPISEAVS